LWLGPGDHREAIERHRDFIASEVLATSVHVDVPPPEDAHTGSVALESGEVTIALRRAAR
jgi:hypothetical protein